MFKKFVVTLCYQITKTTTRIMDSNNISFAQYKYQIGNLVEITAEANEEFQGLRLYVIGLLPNNTYALGYKNMAVYASRSSYKIGEFADIPESWLKLIKL